NWPRPCFYLFGINQQTGDMRVTVDVVLVDADPERRGMAECTLSDLGYHVRDFGGWAQARACLKVHHTVLIVALDAPQLGMLEAIFDAVRACPVPTIIFAERDSPDVIRASLAAGVAVYVAADMQPRRLASLVTLARERFEMQQALYRELEATRRKLGDRRLIEQAKGLLMAQRGLTEEAAFQKLRKMAMDNSLTLGEAARRVRDVLALVGDERA
ncbi:MAG: ANTAR domain-containing protein, partial [Gammaproteobacteria bacterium]